VLSFQTVKTVRIDLSIFRWNR